MVELAAGVLARMGRRLSSAGSILCFHSVAPAGATPDSAMHVPLDLLEDAILAARSQGTIVPLGELVQRHQEGRSTAGLVAVTFDDAYAALLEVAADVLGRLEVPAAIFVATDVAATGGRFWWDRVDAAGARMSDPEWLRFEHACGVPDEFRGQARTFGRGRPLRQWILSRHRGRWPASLDPELDALERAVGTSSDERSMTFAEIERLRALAPIQIGVHTRTHPVLPFLPADEQHAEIAGCFAALRERFDDVLPILAVPFGLFDPTTARIARGAGMSASLTVSGTTLARATSPDPLPRFCLTADEPMWKLQLRLSGMAERIRSWRGDPDTEYPPLPSATT